MLYTLISNVMLIILINKSIPRFRILSRLHITNQISCRQQVFDDVHLSINQVCVKQFRLEKS